MQMICLLTIIQADQSSLANLESLTFAIKDWYSENKLLQNAEKADVLTVGTRTQLVKLGPGFTVNDADSAVVCKSSITLLDVLLDSDLSSSGISSTVSNYHLRALCYIRPTLTSELASTIGRAIVLSRLDYCNALLAGAASQSIDKLQCLQNQVARTVIGVGRRAHAERILNSLPWLPVRQRVR